MADDTHLTDQIAETAAGPAEAQGEVMRNWIDGIRPAARSPFSVSGEWFSLILLNSRS